MNYLGITARRELTLYFVHIIALNVNEIVLPLLLRTANVNAMVRLHHLRNGRSLYRGAHLLLLLLLLLRMKHGRGRGLQQRLVTLGIAQDTIHGVDLT